MYNIRGKEMRLVTSKPPTQAEEDFIASVNYYDVLNNNLTTPQIQEMAAIGIRAIGIPIFAKMPIEYATMEVDPRFNDRLIDEGLPTERVKTYEEYIIILAKNDTHVLGRLCRKEADGNVRRCITSQAMDDIIKVIGVSNLLNESDALAEKANMLPEPEPV